MAEARCLAILSLRLLERRPASRASVEDVVPELQMLSRGVHAAEPGTEGGKYGDTAETGAEEKQLERRELGKGSLQSLSMTVSSSQSVNIPRIEEAQHAHSIASADWQELSDETMQRLGEILLCATGAHLAASHAKIALAYQTYRQQPTPEIFKADDATLRKVSQVLGTELEPEKAVQVAEYWALHSWTGWLKFNRPVWGWKRYFYSFDKFTGQLKQLVTRKKVVTVCKVINVIDVPDGAKSFQFRVIREAGVAILFCCGTKTEKDGWLAVISEYLQNSVIGAHNNSDDDSDDVHSVDSVVLTGDIPTGSVASVDSNTSTPNGSGMHGKLS